MDFNKISNGWSVRNEALYNQLNFKERQKMDVAMLLEIRNTIPKKRKSFEEIYFLTLKRSPNQSLREVKTSDMKIEFLKKEINKLKIVFKLK